MNRIYLNFRKWLEKESNCILLDTREICGLGWNSQMIKQIFAKTDEWKIIISWRWYVFIIMSLWKHSEVYKCQKVPLKNINTTSRLTPKIIFTLSTYPTAVSDVATLFGTLVWLWHRGLGNQDHVQGRIKGAPFFQRTQYKNWLKEQIVFWLKRKSQTTHANCF